MLAKVITLNHGTRGKGFGPVLRYLLRAEAKTDLTLGQALEAGHINLKGEPLWSAAEDPAGYAEDVAVLFNGDVRRCRQRGRVPRQSGLPRGGQLAGQRLYRS